MTIRALAGETHSSDLNDTEHMIIKDVMEASSQLGGQVLRCTPYYCRLVFELKGIDSSILVNSLLFRYDHYRRDDRSNLYAYKNTPRRFTVSGIPHRKVIYDITSKTNIEYVSPSSIKTNSCNVKSVKNTGDQE